MTFLDLAVRNTRDEFPVDPLRVAAETTQASGPRDCCAEFAAVIFCDDQTDTWECPFCGATWTAPCR